MNEEKEFNPECIKFAIEQSKKSADAGCFPAGAVVSEKGQIVAEGISSIIDYDHAERNAVDAAVYRNGGRKILEDGILYSSLEPCLMCFLTAWHGGIRTFVYACEKKAVASEYYESPFSIRELVEAMGLRDAVDLVHAPEFQDDALRVIHAWESRIILRKV